MSKPKSQPDSAASVDMLSSQFVIGTLLILLLGNLILALLLPDMLEKTTLQAVERSNLQVADQVKLTRKYYSENVVARIRKAGGPITADWDWRNNPNHIPLPATMTLDLGDLMKSADTRVELYSPYPWPSRATRKMDDFQSSAWVTFQSDPFAVVQRRDVIHGKRVLRVAVADRLVSEACVSCHDTDVNSPKKDWKLNDVRAVMEVTKVVEPDLAAAELLGHHILLGTSIASLIVALALMLIKTQAQMRARERDQMFARVTEMAYIDTLSGVANRGRFMELAGERLAKAETSFVALIDIDHFKDINDDFGHAAGDEVIVEIGRRLTTFAGQGMTVGRFGGDEFILAGAIQTGGATPLDIARDIVDLIHEPMRYRGILLDLSASIGCADNGRGFKTLPQMIVDADDALYRAKNAGRNRAVQFDEAIHDQRTRRRRIEKLLQQAVTDESFELHFQPVLDIGSRRIVGMEALLRLREPGGSYIPPSEFIPIAEDMRLIVDIGAQVIRNSLRIGKNWPAPVTIAINLSPGQFLTRSSDGRNLVETIQAAIDETGVLPIRIVLEVTESVLLADSDAVISQLESLKSMGIRIALDDFGSGYSSLGYLWKFGFDVLKIDQSFAKGVQSNPQQLEEIVRSIVSLSHTLGMVVIAEGIETDGEREFFTNLGCDGLQGYLIGRPMATDRIAPVLLRNLKEVADGAAQRQLDFGLEESIYAWRLRLSNRHN
ncbi:EAL domain-containing protein [Oryzibacter oryziterrae]|uniref:EAL domain-containing protein n=1 Tax=Oryzibacter oryziterrae TaxID=2766474 RepID=UPI001F16EC2F|nr:EAL domain-containing protein [Oryzibacter oryziterrae]